ncbi:MAG: hypothetical protein DRG87_01080 [Deltaproteobacteria bacterium]|nr:MAG: hypothetical protein DRG87_01080 [Deltaproteobacteria bacterium]
MDSVVSFQMKIKIYFLIVSSLIIFVCNNSPKSYAVFDYEDFDPKAMAWEKIGMQWWQSYSFNRTYNGS